MSFSPEASLTHAFPPRVYPVSILSASAVLARFIDRKRGVPRAEEKSKVEETSIRCTLFPFFRLAISSPFLAMYI